MSRAAAAAARVEYFSAPLKRMMNLIRRVSAVMKPARVHASERNNSILLVSVKNDRYFYEERDF